MGLAGQGWCLGLNTQHAGIWSESAERKEDSKTLKVEATWAQEKETSDMCGGKERKEKQFQNVLDMPGLGTQCSKDCKE